MEKADDLIDSMLFCVVLWVSAFWLESARAAVNDSVLEINSPRGQVGFTPWS